MKVDINKLRKAWRIDHTDKEICELIGMDTKNMTKKFNGTISADLTATQFAVICDHLGTTMEVFVIRDKESK
jgi:hypothetical protein